jgi:tetratricopeptide (TPR) repeat protein
VHESLRAVHIDPSWHASWLTLAWVATNFGQYDDAERFLDSMHNVDSTGKLTPPWIGEQMLRGAAAIRAMRFEDADKQFTESIAAIGNADHICRDAFLALSACGVGDTWIRQGRAELAVAHFRRARNIVKDSPRMLGASRISVRATSGMAARYALSAARERAREFLAEVADYLDRIVPRTEDWLWEGAMGQVVHSVAVAHACAGDSDVAAKYLELAVRTGWRDAGWQLNILSCRRIATHRRDQGIGGN